MDKSHAPVAMSETVALLKRTPPVIEPGHTFESVTETIGHVVLAKRTPIGWFLGFFVAFILLMILNMTIGNLLMLQPLVVADAFGVRDYPRIFSLSQLIMTLGIAAGPFLLGALHDASGYRVAYLVAAGVSVTGSVILLAAGPVSKVKEEHW